MKTIYENGTILARGGIAQALVTDGERILGVGNLDDMRALAGKDAVQIDLEGRTLAPAFIDPHSHFMAVANSMLQLDLADLHSLDELKARIAAYLDGRNLAPGDFLVGTGFDPQDMGGWPGLDALDAVAGGYALVLQHKSGHAAMASSIALTKMGITTDTPDPDGGRIGRENGKLTGYLEENAFLNAQHAFPVPDMDALMDAVVRAQRLYAGHGIATVQEGLMMAQMLPMYQEMMRRGILTLDVVGYPTPQDYAAFADALPGCVGKYSGHVKIGGLKLILDGSPQARTAYMSAPYANADDGYRGYPAMADADIVAALMQADRLGTQVLMHCNGDAAAQQMIDACRAAQANGADLSKIRPVMIHAQTLRPDQMKELPALHITPSFFVAHVYHWGDIHIENLGMARASGISGLASAKALSLPFTLHQDAPVIKPDMLETMWCACVRRTKRGVTLGEGEKIDAKTAFDAVTKNAAMQYGEADKGELAPGMRADMTILSGNPLTTPADALRTIRVERTIAGGRTVYAR